MNFETFQKVYRDYILSEQEVAALRSLLEYAEERYENSQKSIADEFKPNPASDIQFTVDESTVLAVLKKCPISKVFRIPAIPDSTAHPFMLALKWLKTKHPEIFSTKCAIAIKISVSKDFEMIEEIKSDSASCFDMFNTEEGDVRINITQDLNREGSAFIGGMLIQFIPGEEVDNGDNTTNDIILKNEEIILNGISSNDMINFIREVIKEYVKAHPGITIKQLQRDLSGIHRGSKWKFIEERDKIEALAEEKRVFYSLADDGKLDDGTIYVLYNQLLRRKHLVKVIEFAKEEGII